MIQRGRHWDKYASKIIEVLQNYQLSITFGWTPNQIDNIDDDVKRNYLALLTGRSNAKRDK